MAQGRLYITTFRGSLWLNRGHITGPLWKHPFLNTFINQSISMLGNLQYYIDRCELWGIIREINSGIFTCENFIFFAPEPLLHNYKCGCYVPCCVTVNTHSIVSWKKIREMSLTTTLTHNQHDVIDVMWRLPIWNVKIIRYLASCPLQFWSNISKISFQCKHFNYFGVLL